MSEPASSAFAHHDLSVDGRHCRLSVAPFVEMLNLRGDAADPAFAAAVERITGLALPVEPNGAAASAARRLFWLGPDEWLLVLRDARAADVEAGLRAALAGRRFGVVDVGHGHTSFTLRGPAAAGLLARGCPLDLHQRAFPPGALAQSHVAKASALIHRPADEMAGGAPVFELIARRSFADYLFRWLCSAGD